MEILHKAKTLNGKWIEGFYCSRADTTYCCKDDYDNSPPVETHHFIAMDCVTDWGMPNSLKLKEIDVNTLCVYTGVKDKKRRKIFTNDIVKKGFDNFVVRFDEEQCKFDFFTNKNCPQAGFNAFISDFVEIIGNEIDNPELIAEKG